MYEYDEQNIIQQEQIDTLDRVHQKQRVGVAWLVEKVVPVNNEPGWLYC